MRLIKRKLYSDMIDSWLGTGQILVLTGQRRAGKSSILLDFAQDRQNPEKSNVIYIDKEKNEFSQLLDFRDLNAYIDAHLVPSHKNYILIDEVQDIDGWEKSLRSYRTDENIDIIVTGSNSKMLSGELSTLIGGRYQEIHVLPLSYPEFLEFSGLADSDDSLSLYLSVGGLPGIHNLDLKNENQLQEYYSGVYNTVILKDIIERYKVRNPILLGKLARYLADTSGKLISANNIAKSLSANGENANVNSVIDYLTYLQDAFLISACPRYDIHGKKLLETNGKYYFEDFGMRNLLAPSGRVADIEKTLENIVYAHLRLLGYTVYVGQLRSGEVDFVCEYNGSRCYVQACYLVASEDTEKREFGNLSTIQDNYPKYVISMSPLLKRQEINGIIHLGLRQFLVNGLY